MRFGKVKKKRVSSSMVRFVNGIQAKDENTQPTTLNQFRDYCGLSDMNISDKVPKGKFKVKCGVCGSNEAQLLFDDKIVCGDYEYTRIWTDTEMKLVFKCLRCGNAHTVVGE